MRLHRLYLTTKQLQVAVELIFELGSHTLVEAAVALMGILLVLGQILGMFAFWSLLICYVVGLLSQKILLSLKTIVIFGGSINWRART